MYPGLELTKYHILRRNRIIDYIRQHFVPRTPEHPEISPMHPEGVEEFCQKLQKFADYLKTETLQDILYDRLNRAVGIVEQEKMKLIYSGPILFMKDRFPNRFWFAHRCKYLIHLMIKLRISLWRSPVPKKENKQ